MFHRIFSLFLVVTALASAAILPAAAESDVHDRESALLFINLTSDDIWRQDMALGFAEKALHQGHRIAVFLNVRAVSLAMKSSPVSSDEATGQTRADKVRQLTSMGARVFLCPSCTERAGLTVDDRLDGIELGGPELIALMMRPSTKVISY